MKVKFKKINKNATIPSYAKPGDAGMDLTSASDIKLVTQNDGEDVFHYVEFDTGIAVEIPEGYVGLLFPRSSISKTVLSLANSVGVVDSGYRDSIKLRFKLDGLAFSTKYGNAKLTEERLKGLAVYKKGERIGQLMIVPIPTIEPVEAKRLTKTVRGKGGFGSSGK